MPRKPKFKPVITRIRLNPEQSVLLCSCYDGGIEIAAGTQWGTPDVKGCIKSTKTIDWWGLCAASGLAKVWLVKDTKVAAS